MADRAAGIDDVGHIPLAVLVLGGEDRLLRPAQHLGRIVLVEQSRADRIFAHRPDAVGEKQPALVRLDGRAAIADLHQLPWENRGQDLLALVPMRQRVGLEQEQVLAVLPPDHHILPADLAGEERHALVARRRSGHRHQVERAEIAGPHQFGLDARAVISGIGADPLQRAVVMRELDDAHILQPLGLGLGDREDDRPRQRRVAMAMDGDRAARHILVAPAVHVGRGRERRLGRQAQLVLIVDDAFAERDRGDVPLAHRPHRHQDALRPRLDTGLVEMRHRRRIHQRGGGIAVFVAEIGANQLALLVADRRPVELQQILDLIVAAHEDAPRLPVPGLEIL